MNMSHSDTWCVYVSQVDLLPEISQAPHILYDVEPALKNKQLKAEVDEYLKVFMLLITATILANLFTCMSGFWALS